MIVVLFANSGLNFGLSRTANCSLVEEIVGSAMVADAFDLAMLAVNLLAASMNDTQYFNVNSTNIERQENTMKQHQSG